jgi:hypothetical protein
MSQQSFNYDDLIDEGMLGTPFYLSPFSSESKRAELS